ncbi:hypothetical protein N0V88_002791 [Collariella sp. IMI 366227]|nr:hypothetical protein N0V88_002791 [Collariella sp. IMI 366227]
MPTALAPPPSSIQKPPRRKSNVRLRSDSGLALHTNQAGFRQYTGYNPDGSLPLRPSPVRTLSSDDNSSVEDFDLGRESGTDLRGFKSHDKVLPDFFEPAVIKLAFTNPSTAQRLRKFAETRHNTADIDFLMKVEEYSRTLGGLVSTMTYISSNFTGATATSPLGLPMDITRAQRSNKRFCVRTALPALDRLYEEAKTTVEERLSQNLYPEFIKYQLSQCLITSLSINRFFTEDFKTPYPGLGDAFCLTDPLTPDDPIIYASDGLVAMSGYDRSELVGKNCRLLQGIATDADAVCRLSRAISAGKEVTELILNHRPDGTAYWNLLFVCPLMEYESVRYFLGAQVNVSEHMGSDYQDIMSVLNFGPPLENHQIEGHQITRTSTISSHPRQSTDTLEVDHPDDQQSHKRISRRQRFFKHFHRKSPHSRTSSPSRHSTASDTAIAGDTVSSPSTGSHHDHSFTSFQVEQPHPYHHMTIPFLFDEDSTPYSRFFVMHFTPLPSPPTPPHPPPTPPSSPNVVTNLPTAAAAPRAPPTNDAHKLADCDVFTVLSSPAYLGSPSVSRALRCNIVNKLTEGKPVTVDIMAPRYRR